MTVRTLIPTRTTPVSRTALAHELAQAAVLVALAVIGIAWLLSGEEPVRASTYLAPIVLPLVALHAVATLLSQRWLWARGYLISAHRTEDGTQLTVFPRWLPGRRVTLSAGKRVTMIVTTASRSYFTFGRYGDMYVTMPRDHIVLTLASEGGGRLSAHLDALPDQAWIDAARAEIESLGVTVDYLA